MVVVVGSPSGVVLSTTTGVYEVVRTSVVVVSSIRGSIVVVASVVVFTSVVVYSPVNYI